LETEGFVVEERTFSRLLYTPVNQSTFWCNFGRDLGQQSYEILFKLAVTREN
jgi:hypothetical protein